MIKNLLAIKKDLSNKLLNRTQKLNNIKYRIREILKDGYFLIICLVLLIVTSIWLPTWSTFIGFIGAISFTKWVDGPNKITIASQSTINLSSTSSVKVDRKP